MRQGSTHIRHAPLGIWYRFAVSVLKPPLTALTRRDWRGAEHLPDTGGVVVAPNHVSHSDPLVVGHFLYDHGYPPRFLGKEGLFRLFLVGRVLRGAGQIPVYRETADAAQAYSAAVAAVRAGECVAIYPEATLTRDPALWPMVGKTGAARVALETGAPLVPIAQWGPQVLMPPYSKRLRLLPRTTMHVWAGAPVDLDDLRGREVDGPLLVEATERVMAAITSLLEQIRGEQAPPHRFDPRSDGRPVIGDPDGRISRRDRRERRRR